MRSKPTSNRSSSSHLPESNEPDLQTYLAYADHLNLRRQRDRCLEVIDQALKSPQASRRTAAQIVMGLHVVAVEMALSTEEDKGRFEKAGPHIQALLDCPEPKAQGFGHLFAGSVDLDRSGISSGQKGRRCCPGIARIKSPRSGRARSTT